MVQFVDQNTFEHKLNEGQNPKNRGYPNQWQKPHWNGDSIYNQYLRVTLNEPDGTREYYDPVTGTHSYEHCSGYHRAITTDSHIENVPGKKLEYIGGGGHSYTCNGHRDNNYGGHVRNNYQQDVYNNHQGVAHNFYQGGHVSVTVGNEIHEHGGSVKHRVAGAGPQGSWGVGVGPGDGDNHDNAITMSANTIYVRAYTNSNVHIQTKNNDITITCGNTVTITSVADVDVISQKSINANAAVSIVASAPTINVGADSMTKTINIGMGSQIINFNGGGPVVPPFTCV